MKINNSRNSQQVTADHSHYRPKERTATDSTNCVRAKKRRLGCRCR